MPANILIVDDEESIRFTFEMFLSEEGHHIVSTSNYGEAVPWIEKMDLDLVFLDIILGGRSGIDLLQKTRKTQPRAPVIMITGVPSIETATESLRYGAYDYIIKPITQEELLRLTGKALEHKYLLDEKEKCRLNFEAIFRSVNDGIITVDECMKVAEINNAATGICGVQRQDIVGKDLDALSNTCGGKCVWVLQKVNQTRKPVELRYVEYRNAQNKSQVVSLYGSPLLSMSDEFQGALVVLHDETRVLKLERSLREYEGLGSIVGKSKSIQRVKALIGELSNYRTTVLVRGESGTGKELVVDALHQMSDNRDKPLVKVNCAALSDNLLESELFGHVRGAFTGAVSKKIGRFERADGGTIFLDEIGDISQRMQLRLLRFTETMEFERVGDSTPIKVNVRIIAATNQDLEMMVERGLFREDLYYRLKVIEIRLPPLRERREDIPLLVKHFLRILNRRFNMDIKSVTADVWSILMNYHWPGNIRELENIMEHAFVKCNQNVITVNDLPSDLNKSHGILLPSVKSDSDLEAEQIRKALEKTYWNKSKAAKMLGLSRRTIYRKIERYGLTSQPI